MEANATTEATQSTPKPRREKRPMNGVDVPPFDFSVPGVCSISADLHKYGYAAKGASTLFHQSEEQRAHQVFEFQGNKVKGRIG